MEVRFSIIIPCFNRADLIERAIKSVLNQTQSLWELIVVDDGSTDHIKAVVDTFPAVSYVYQSNSGVSSARNHGAQLATGEWLIFLDSDDELLPEALQVFHNVICNKTEASVIKAGHLVIPIEGTKRSEKSGAGYIPGSFCITKEIFHQVGGYDERLKFAENTELVFRLQKQKAQITKVNQLVLRYFENASGGSKNLQNMLDSIRLILTEHADYLPPHVKHLYHQNIGVIEIRFGNFEAARRHLWKSWRYKPQNFSTLIRLGIAYMPLLAGTIYPLKTGKQ